MNKQELELVAKLKIYFAVVNEIDGGRAMGVSPWNEPPPRNMCDTGELIKFVNEPKKMECNKLMIVKAVFHYGKQIISDLEQGWRVIDCDHTEELYVSFPDFLFTIANNEDEIRKEAFRFKGELEYDRLKRRREAALSELKKVDEEIVKHSQQYGGNHGKVI